MKRLLIVLFLILVLGIAVFLLYRSGFREGLVSLEIEAPDTVTAGEEVSFMVKVENKNRTDLSEARLSFSYPEGSIPLDEDGRALDSLIQNTGIGDLENGEKKEFVFRAVITGERGEIKRVNATLNYSPSSIRSVFEKSAEETLTISKLSVPLTLSAPPNVLSGQRVRLTLDFRNETGQDFEDLQILFSYPDGFSLTRAVPSPDEGNNVFSVPSLEAGQGDRITVEGEISGFEKEGKRFTAVLRKKIGDRFFDFQRVQTLLTVSTPLLTADITVNNRKEFIAAAGDRLKYRISFSNNSNNNFSALELRAKLESPMFDFATLKTDGFFDQGSQTILWNAAVQPLLANLAPNQSGEVSFEIELKDDFPRVFGSKNHSLRVNAGLETASVPPDFDLDKISASAVLLTNVSSKTALTSEAFYNDSVFVNSGPVPPRVGQKTTYAVHWKIVNEGNDLTNVRVVSFLLPGISWENNFRLTPSQSDLRYDPSLGRVSWLISTVPAGTGTVSEVFEAVFQIGITPGSNQAGQSVDLVKETALEAVDNFTKVSITLTRPKISTSSIIDSPGTVQSDSGY